MKKFLVFVTLLFFIIAASPPTKAVSLNTDYPVEMLIMQTDVQTIVLADEAYPAESYQFQTFVQEEPAPNLPELPGPDATKSDWLWWAFGAGLFLLEIILRLVPTARSYSIIAIVYKVLSLLAKDRSVNNSTFKVQRE
jgi:hypothetical protein